MSREIFVIGDTHFGCHSAVKWSDDSGNLVRPFSSSEEMDEHMIERWNNVVRPQDHVWHLGDIATSGVDDFEVRVLSRLNGVINLVVGNHDNVRRLCDMKRFKKVVSQRRFDDMGLYLTHVPIHRSSCWNYRLGRHMLNVHGHIHMNVVPEDGYFNACVEKIDYTPVNIELLRIW